MVGTKIAWTDNTFNPWVGCEAVSPGCANCYAKQMTERWHGNGTFAIRRRTAKSNWMMPEKWNREAFDSGRRVKVFCGSMCDWLDDQVPAEWLNDLLFEIAKTPYIDWLMLTKRPENFRKRMELACGELKTGTAGRWLNGVCPENVWFGVTAENQEMWDRRVNVLREIPARVRWVSVEPMLEAVFPRMSEEDHLWVDWVVAGGENGPGARICRREWIVRLCGRCRDLETPFFWKQWGSRAEGLEDDEEELQLRAQLTETVRDWPE